MIDKKYKNNNYTGIDEDIARQQEALERLQKITNRLPGVLFQLRRAKSGRLSIPYASDAFSDLFPLDLGQVRNDASQLVGIIHPHDYPDLLASITTSADSLCHWEHGFRIKLNDGGVRWLMGDAMPEQEADGSVLWHGYINDISYRKSTENALKESIKHTQVIMDSVVDGVITIDGRGIISSFNPSAQRIFGFRADEAIGNNVQMLMPEPYRSQHDGYLENYIKTGTKHIIGIGREVLGQRKDGNLFPLELAVSELELSDKLMFLGLVRDISDRKQQEAQLLAAKEEAERANLAKSQFLSNMSHELRTPMNAVLGFAQLMELDPGLSGEQKECTGEIIKAGKHLLDLINDILDLAKIESANFELSIETVILPDIIRSCLALLRPMLEARGIKVDINYCSGVVLQADPMRLKQCLLNLLSNAVKYNKPNGLVSVSCELANPGRIRILVCDTGMGIAPELQGEVFKPFNRLGVESLDIQGTGIGLAITRQLVELMGGTIGMESQKGFGSTFWLELPEGGIANSLEPVPVASNQPAQILFIDKKLGNTQRISKLLSQRPDIRLITADSAHLDLGLLATENFDLILLDVDNLTSDGVDFLNDPYVKKLLGKLPVVALIKKGHSDNECTLAGFAACLVQPIDGKLFYAMLDELLDSPIGL